MISVPSSISEVSVSEMKPSVATTDSRSPEAGRFPHSSSAVARIRFPRTGMKHLVMAESSVGEPGPVASDVHLCPGYRPGLLSEHRSDRVVVRVVGRGHRLGLGLGLRVLHRGGGLSVLDFGAGRSVSDLSRLRGSRSEEHTSELQSLMRISYAVFCFNKKTTKNN